MTMRERQAVRVIPRQAVSVEISADQVSASPGMVANISELGACVWTEEPLAAGEKLVLRLSFRGEPGEPFQAAGRVVWVDREVGEGRRRRCGLRWAHTTGPHHERLKTLLTNC